MKPSPILIALSVTANVVLAAWWLLTSTAAHGLAVPTPTSNAGYTNGAAASAFSWSDLETDDLKEFLRRLRAVGCPDKTTRDLVLDEVDRRYGLKKRELWPERKNPPPFWKAEKHDLAMQKANREKLRQNRALEAEKTALVVDLFGRDPRPERRQDEGVQENTPWQDSRVSFLPESKQAAVAQCLDDFEERTQEFYAQNLGLKDAQYRADQNQLEATRLSSLATLLTPHELREFELRNSRLARQLASELRNLPPLTRSQYEALYDIRKKFGDGIHSFEDDPNPSAGANQKVMQAEIAAALGPDLAQSYRRAHDPAFIQLARLAARNNLPDDTARRVYDTKESAEARLRQLPTGTPEPSEQAVQQIKTDTADAIHRILGDRCYQTYLHDGGEWLVHLASSPP